MSRCATEYFYSWNSVFVEAKEMVMDFCLYVFPFPSTMFTARQPHTAALLLKSFVYDPFHGRSLRCLLSLSFAKGQSIRDAPPIPKDNSNSTTPTSPINTTNQPNPNPKKPPHQTHPISRMRVAMKSEYILRIKEFAILSYANSFRRG